MILNDLSAIQYLAIALALGFIVAIIWTNIQRSAYAKFIKFLCDNRVFGEESAKELSEMGISGLSAKIVKSSCAKKYSLGRYVSIIKSDVGDTLQARLEGADREKYYLSDCDTQELTDKYAYTKLSAKYIIISIVGLIVAVCFFIFAADIIIDRYTEEKNKSEQTQNKDDEENNEDSGYDNEGDEAPDGEGSNPSIPV